MRMSRPPALGITCLLILAAGVAHGLLTDRWVVARERQDFAARLGDVPATVGDWVGEDRDFDVRQVEKADVDGYLSRSYVRRGSRDRVDVLLVCGRPGPVALHPPTVCYPALGYELTGPEAVVAVSAGRDAASPGSFFHAQFQKKGAVQTEDLRILWAWNAGDGWQAADNPRVRFARQPALCKLYLVHPLAKADSPIAKDVTLDFLKVLIPELERRLFSAPSSQPRH